MYKQLITVEDLLEWDACYEEGRIRRLVGDGVTPLQVLDRRRFKGVSEADRIWVVARPEVMSERKLRLFACWCARQALGLLKDPDERMLSAVVTAEKYAFGQEDAAALSAAESAAYSAADSAADSAVYSVESAAYSAAYSAADSAAYSAADSAVYSAAESAADSAAYSAADSAVYSAAWSAQVSRFKRIYKAPFPSSYISYCGGLSRGI